MGVLRICIDFGGGTDGADATEGADATVGVPPEVIRLAVGTVAVVLY